MKISVVIPIHNAEVYLRDCLSSVARQQFDFWEAICVNDGSVDGSKSIILEYAGADSRFRCIEQECKGVSEARNVGVAAATGDYVTFLDADDTVTPLWLKNIADEMQRDSADVLRTGFVHWREGRQECVERFSCDSVSGSVNVIRKICSEYMGYGQVWMLAVRTSVAQRVRFVPDLRLREDLVYLLDIAGLAASFRQLSHADYLYREHPNSACSRVYDCRQALCFIHEIVRIYSAARAMSQGDRDAAMAKGIGAEILKAFFEWLYSCPAVGISDGTAFSKPLSECCALGLVRRTSLSARWWSAYFCLRWFGSCVVFLYTERIFRWMRKIQPSR